MKAKLVLLLIAVVGSMALVASAQTPTYVVNRPGQGPDVLVATPAVPQPPPPPAAPSTFGRDRAFGIPGQNTWVQAFTLSGEDHSLARQAEQLAQQLASAKSDSDREKIKGQLAELLEKQFDQRQKRHEDEINQLEAQIKKLKNLVDKRQENRREIISTRLNQIVKESQGLGW